MLPNQVSKRLYKIAAQIDESRAPSRSLVISNLRTIISNLQPGAQLEPSDIENLEEVIQQLSDIVMSKNASESEILQAMEKLQSVSRTLKRHRVRQQMDPKAQYVPLRSIHDKPITRKSSAEVLNINISANFFGMICKKYKTVMKHIFNPSEDVQLVAVNSDPYSIQYIKNPPESVQLSLVSKMGHLIEYIKNPSEAVQLVAVRHDLAIQYINNPSEEVQLTSVSHNPHSIKYINNPSEEVQLAAVRKNPYAIQYIENPCEEAIDIARVNEVQAT
jgi:hypothetical protein